VIESMLPAVQARLRTCQKGDPTQTLADGAESEARELWRASQEASADHSIPFDVVYVIASLLRLVVADNLIHAGGRGSTETHARMQP